MGNGAESEKWADRRAINATAIATYCSPDCIIFLCSQLLGGITQSCMWLKVIYKAMAKAKLSKPISDTVFLTRNLIKVYKKKEKRRKKVVQHITKPIL